jgi:cell division protein ZipA
MEFGTREILIILGIVVILGILLDGFRRVRHARTGTLKVHRRKQPIFEDDGLDELPGELLSGEVRVTIRDPESAEQVSDHIKRNREQNTQRCTSAYRDIGQVRDEANVVRFQPAAPAQEESRGPQGGSGLPGAEHQRAGVEPEADAAGYPEPQQHDIADDHHREVPPAAEQPVSLSEFDVDDDDHWREPATTRADPEARPDPEPWGVTRDDLDEDISGPFHLEAPEESARVAQPPRRKPFWEDSPAPKQPPQRPPEKARTQQPQAPEPQAAPAAQQPPADPDMVVVLHVMAKTDTVIRGPALLEALLANGLRYGSMQIFHRHEHKDGSGPVHFSLANSLKPGTFDLSAMDTFETPGVTLFMPVGGLPNALESFNELIKTAQNLAKSLNAVLKDETRSALTKQTIEHQRQQIIEYTRRSFTLTH